jgi:hypothetical protein
MGHSATTGLASLDSLIQETNTLTDWCRSNGQCFGTLEVRLEREARRDSITNLAVLNAAGARCKAAADGVRASALQPHSRAPSFP